MRPTRESVEGRAYLDLQSQARRDKRPTDELLALYALEGFLARLAASPEADLLVLKGGVLLAAFGARRPTRDVDLQAHHVSNDVESVLALIRNIAAVDVQDGLDFTPDGARAEIIRDTEQYPGVRVTLGCSLGRADVSFHVDVNVGDPIAPPAQRVAIPRLLGGELHVLGYPLAMVHAEKIVTALGRGVVNTRWRDFGDLYILSRRHDVDGTELATALATVATHRQIALRPLAVVLAGYHDLAQTRYQAWRRKNRRDELPEQFGDVLSHIIAFTDPALGGGVVQLTWRASEISWR